jgi:hypothetical protein
LPAENGHETNGTETAADWPSAKGLYEMIKCTATLKNLTEADVKSLSLKLLILANVPLLKNASFDARLYERFLKKLLASNQTSCQLDLPGLVEKLTEDFVKVTTDQNTLSQVS